VLGCLDVGSEPLPWILCPSERINFGPFFFSPCSLPHDTVSHAELTVLQAGFCRVVFFGFLSWPVINGSACFESLLPPSFLAWMVGLRFLGLGFPVPSQLGFFFLSPCQRLLSVRFHEFFLPGLGFFLTLFMDCAVCILAAFNTRSTCPQRFAPSW